MTHRPPHRPVRGTPSLPPAGARAAPELHRLRAALTAADDDPDRLRTALLAAVDALGTPPPDLTPPSAAVRDAALVAAGQNSLRRTVALALATALDADPPGSGLPPPTSPADP